MGTATTIQLVSAEGFFHGYIILPGMMTALGSLTEKASLLKSLNYSLATPPPIPILATHTTDAITSGAIMSHVFIIEGYIKKIFSDYTHLGDIKVIATGGLSSLVIQHTSMIDIFDEHLLLEGLARTIK